MKSGRPLRILMLIHTRWSRDLGGPRAQRELGALFAERGHQVSKFSYEDAFTDQHRLPLAGPLGRLASHLLQNRSFAKRAAAYIRRHASSFDVVDANQTDVPFSKASLGFEGLLVARSVGLIPLYLEWDRISARRWPTRTATRDRLLAAAVLPASRRRLRHCLASFHHADLLSVPNTDELAWMRSRPQFANKAVHLPLGIQSESLDRLGVAALSPEARQAKTTIAFIGTWNSRKGAHDWPSIFARVRSRVPSARLLLLGTGMNPQAVLAGFSPDDRPRVEVHAHFDPDALPALLAEASVGAFPSYLEGFGFAALEKLAAGLPTVAYDAPGPRDILASVADHGLVPAGNVAAFADTVCDHLTISPSEYERRSRASRAAARAFQWDPIADQTLHQYSLALERARSDRRRAAS
ncbi:MAG TPA: glycosyltransferase family 4 protein [Thermoanaerobaculia bacterium]|nr:glycosyltransferase family 4 protein [Thermoanaerobaculia bacterium]